jgi:hypothetical protein
LSITTSICSLGLGWPYSPSKFIVVHSKFSEIKTELKWIRTCIGVMKINAKKKNYKKIIGFNVMYFHVLCAHHWNSILINYIIVITCWEHKYWNECSYSHHWYVIAFLHVLDNFKWYQYLWVSIILNIDQT